MAIAIGVSAKGTTGSATTVTTTGVNTQASGSVIVAGVQIGAAFTFVSVADNKGNSGNYVQIGTELVSGGVLTRLYYVENAAGGAGHTVTFTASGAAPMTAFFVEITGALISGALSDADRVTDTATPWASPSIDAVQTELLVGIAIENGPGGTINHTMGNSFTKLVEEIDGGSFYTGVSSYRIVSAGAYNTSYTTDNEGGISESMSWIAGFKEAAGGGMPFFTQLGSQRI